MSELRPYGSPPALADWRGLPDIQDYAAPVPVLRGGDVRDGRRLQARPDDNRGGVHMPSVARDGGGHRMDLPRPLMRGIFYSCDGHCAEAKEERERRRRVFKP